MTNGKLRDPKQPVLQSRDESWTQAIRPNTRTGTTQTCEEIFGEEIGQLVWEAINTCVRQLFVEYKNMYATK